MISTHSGNNSEVFVLPIIVLYLSSPKSNSNKIIVSYEPWKVDTGRKRDRRRHFIFYIGLRFFNKEVYLFSVCQRRKSAHRKKRQLYKQKLLL